MSMSWLLAVGLLVHPVLGTHFRYGTYSWKQQTVGNPGGDVLFTAEAAWRIDYSTRCPRFRLYFGDGTSQSLTMETVDTGDDWRMCQGSYLKSYSGNGPYTVTFSGGNRISDLNNNADERWNLVAKVILSNDMNNMAVSPITTGFPVVSSYFRSTEPVTFAIPTYVADFLPLVVEFDTQYDQPSGMTVNEDGTFFWDTAGLALGLYSVTVQIKKADGIEIPFDFMITLMDVPEGATPVMLLPADGSTLNFFINSPVQVHISADHADVFELTTLPTGATTTDVVVSGTQISTQLEWTSSYSEVRPICVRAFAGALYSDTFAEQVCFSILVVDCTQTCPSYQVCLNGICQCAPGTSGPVCDTTCAICLNGGVCDEDLLCDCTGTGYNGDNCEIPICEQSCGTGACVAPNTCNCEGTGFSGPNCTNPICDPKCENGLCIAAPSTCECYAGYTGAQCTVAVCDSPCLNGGECTGPNTCTCSGSYSGPTCSNPLCASPCQNGGVCVSVSPDVCDCSGTGYSGQYCTTPVCDPSCVFGVCTLPNTCSCSSGYSGPLCQYADCIVPGVTGGVWKGACGPGVSATHSSTCQFQASVGHSCSGEGSRLCTDGEWDQIPVCGQECEIPAVVGGAWSGCVEGEFIAAAATCELVPDAGYTCTDAGVRMCTHSGALDYVPYCAATCLVPTVAGGSWAGCNAGTEVENGMTCSFSALPGYSCTEDGTKVCSSGSLGNEPVCTALCAVPTTTGGTWGCSGDVSPGTTCTFATSPGFTCLWTGARVCEAGGTWDQTPTCLAQCTVPSVDGGAWKVCEVDDQVDSASHCTLNAVEGYVCTHEDEENVCSDGFFTLTPECHARCDVPTVRGAVFGEDYYFGCVPGLSVPHGERCPLGPASGYTCFPENVTGLRLCEDGNWDLPEPTCVGDCVVPTLPGGIWNYSGCFAGASVVHGWECFFTAKDGQTCQYEGTRRCIDGVWDRVPECVGDCVVPSIEGGDWSAPCAEGDQVASGVTCDFTASAGFTCEHTSTRECSNAIWDLTPVCYADCPVPTITGGSWSDCGATVTHLSSCTFMEAGGYICSFSGATQCRDGVLQNYPVCSAPCSATPMTGGDWGTCSGLVESGQSCAFAATAGYTCSETGPRTCTNGIWSYTPVCLAQCGVPTTLGGAWSGDGCSGSVDSGRRCTFEASPGYTCVGTGVRTCSNGIFDQYPVCLAKCAVTSVVGGSWGSPCAVGAHVSSGESCTLAAASGYQCTFTGGRLCTDGSWDETPVCAADCPVPSVSGGTWDGCTGGSSIPSGTACDFAQSSGYTCTDVGTASCTNGNLNRSPACLPNCRVPVLLGVDWTDCVGDAEVGDTATCAFTASSGFTCTGSGTVVCRTGTFEGLPTCKASCPVPNVAGGSWGCSVFVASGASCVFTAGSTYGCEHDSTRLCSEGSWDETPVCAQKCRVPTITGGSFAGEGCVDPYAFSGTQCEFVPVAGYSCSADEAECVQGAWDVTPTCQPDCSIPSIIGGTWTAVGDGPDCGGISSVASSSQCFFTVEEGYDCENAAVRTCLSGSFDLIPSCLAKCVVPTVSGGVWSGTGCTPGMTVSSGDACVLSEDAGSTCLYTGSVLCINGAWDSDQLSCSPDCSVPAITGGTWSGAGCVVGQQVSTGVTCTFAAKTNFVCVNEGDVLCDTAVWSKSPSCQGPCLVPGVTGGVWDCGSGNLVTSGTVCEFTAAADYSCADAGTQTCTNGVWSAVPSCIARCAIPAVSGGSWSPCSEGDLVVDASRCTFSAHVGYTCTATGEAECVAGSMSQNPSCTPDCRPGAISGGSWDAGCGEYVSAGDSCLFTAASGYTCLHDGSRTCQFLSGIFDQTPKCFAKCQVPTVAGGAWSGNGCTAGASVPSGTTCFFSAQSDYLCAVEGDAFASGEVTCTNGQLSHVPACEAMCSVTAVVGGTWDCTPGALVAPGEACVLAPNEGYTCTGAGGTCVNGYLGPRPVCSAGCATFSVLGGTWSAPCDSMELVDHSTACTLSPNAGSSCEHDGVRTCSEGSWDAYPKCSGQCSIPQVVGGVWSGCSAGTQISSGDACDISQVTGYTCSDVGVVTCKNGNLDKSPSCAADCSIPDLTGGTWEAACSSGSVASGTGCLLAASVGYVCSANSATCNRGVLHPPITCEANCPVSEIYGGLWRGESGVDCTPGAEVNSGQQCAFSPLERFDCVFTDLRTCSNGNWDKVPSCEGKCRLPSVQGGTWTSVGCLEQYYVSSGKVCAIIPEVGYECSYVGDVQCVDGSMDRTVNCSDTVPPFVVSGHVAERVNRLPVEVLFSEPMEVSFTLKSYSLVVTSTGSAVPGNLSWSPSNDALTFTPNPPFSNAESYTIAVTAGATDLAGNYLDPAWTSTFLAFGAPFDLDYGNLYVFRVGDVVDIPPPISEGGAPTLYTEEEELPVGFLINATSGVISGVALQESPKDLYRITASNAGGTTTSSFFITVLPALAPNETATETSTTSGDVTDSGTTTGISNQRCNEHACSTGRSGDSSRASNVCRADVCTDEECCLTGGGPGQQVQQGAAASETLAPTEDCTVLDIPCVVFAILVTVGVLCFCAVMVFLMWKRQREDLRHPEDKSEPDYSSSISYSEDVELEGDDAVMANLKKVKKSKTPKATVVSSSRQPVPTRLAAQNDALLPIMPLEAPLPPPADDARNKLPPLFKPPQV